VRGSDASSGSFSSHRRMRLAHTVLSPRR